jgi:hypothetical protein
MGQDWAIALDLDSAQRFVQSTAENNAEGKKPSWGAKPLPEGFTFSLPAQPNRPSKAASTQTPNPSLLPIL